MKYVFGIDVGGTSIKIGLLDQQGSLVDSFSIPTNLKDQGSHILKEVAQAIHAFNDQKGLKDSDILGYGFGLPGPVVDNTAIQCVNLGWKNVNVEKEFQYALGKKVLVKAGNDATVAAAGEYWKQNIEGDIIFITLGTGVGGGIIANGKVIDGAHGAGGEIGHIRAEFNEPQACTCGLEGCLETETSIRSINARARKLMKLNTYKTTIVDDENLSPKRIFNAAKMGDELGLAVADKVGEYLGLTCSMLAATVDPKAILIGGGISNAGQVLIDAIKKHYRKYAFSAIKDMQFELAKLGNDAGMYGAGYLIIAGLQA
ncbi:ROK family protein [Acholeplasma vituli]|uniref:ROK family protein n=1 Tax=Paracholeplasma vituli TaxID=69473 RepID=A0ABT2PX50_9MOLU|nr:ROK family protein [Paracholeplasma vituli]MCU0104228.1 ROK family protein [Paracholeplasma vituli]